MPVEVLVGNIGSGKSTYARERARQGAVILNKDSLIASLHGGLYTEYDRVLKGQLYDRLFDAALVLAIRTKRDVVVDNRNHTEQSRERVIQVAKEADVAVVCTVFERNHPSVHLLRRLQDDDRGYDAERWRKVAWTTDKEWEYPNALEGFESITTMKERTMDDVQFDTEVGRNSIANNADASPSDQDPAGDGCIPGSGPKKMPGAGEDPDERDRGDLSGGDHPG